MTIAGTDEQARETALARVVASVCGVGLFAAFFAVDQRGLLLWSGRFNTDSHQVTFGALALVAALLPWVAPHWRSRVLLASSLLFGARLLHELIVVPALLAWLATRVARTGWQNWRKLALLLGFWVAVPVTSWILPSTNSLRYGCLLYTSPSPRD